MHLIVTISMLFLCIYTLIYVYICVYRCILACIWFYSTLLLSPLARRVAHDSKGATQNCQIQSQCYPGIAVLSVSIAS